MVLSPEGVVVISFLGFALVFAWKVYPQVVRALDGYIQSVKDALSKAEGEQRSASRNFNAAKEKEKEVGRLIESERLDSEKRMCQLRKDNERLLNLFRERYEISSKVELESEVRKQKNLLIDRLSDLIVDEIESQAVRHERRTRQGIRASDLKKLL